MPRTHLQGNILNQHHKTLKLKVGEEMWKVTVQVDIFSPADGLNLSWKSIYLKERVATLSWSEVFY